MHEYSITQDMLSLALERANEEKASKITQINLVIGELSGVDAEGVQYLFGFLSKETIASDAIISIEKIPMQLRCRNCAAVFPYQNHDWCCPNCHETGVEIISGRECYLESIEVE